MQHAVFVVFQHVEHITFTTLLCYLAACRQRFVFGVLQFFLQFVQLDDIVLDIVSVGYVDNDKKHDEDNEPYLPAYDLCGKNVSTRIFRSVKLDDPEASSSMACLAITSLSEACGASCCCGSCCGVSCFGGSCDACAFSSAIGFSLMFMSLSFIISFLLFLVWRFCS